MTTTTKPSYRLFISKRNTDMTTTTKPSHRLFTLLDEEYVTPEQVIDMLVKYLSEDDLAEMLDMNELSQRFRDLRDFY